MDPTDWLDVFSRWLHILGAVVLVGGPLVWLLTLRTKAQPVGEAAPVDPADASLAAALKPAVHGAVLVVLLTGVWNLYSKWGTLTPAYGLTVLVKMVLGLGLMFLASVLVGRSAAFAPIRANVRPWLTGAVALGVVVVLLACILTHLPPKT